MCLRSTNLTLFATSKVRCCLATVVSSLYRYQQDRGAFLLVKRTLCRTICPSQKKKCPFQNRTFHDYMTVHPSTILISALLTIYINMQCYLNLFLSIYFFFMNVKLAIYFFTQVIFVCCCLPLFNIHLLANISSPNWFTDNNVEKLFKPPRHIHFWGHLKCLVMILTLSQKRDTAFGA